MLQVAGLSKSFQENALLFSPISFSLTWGEKMRISGRNGVGKTTFLKCLAGFLEPNHGEVLLKNKKLKPLDSAFSPAHERAFFPKLSLHENLSFFKKFYDSPLEIEPWMKALELQPLQHRPYQNCSSGIRKRLSLVRAIIKNSPLLLLDEPLANVDPEGKALFLNLIVNHDFFNSKILILSSNEEFDSQGFRRLHLQPTENHDF